MKLIINGNDISEINLFNSSYNFSSIVLVDGAIYVIDINGILHGLNEQILSNSLLNAFPKNEALLGLSLDDVMLGDEILSDWATEEEDGITEWGGDLFDLFEAMGALNLGDVYGNELSYEEIEALLIENTMLMQSHIISNVLKPLIKERKIEKTGRVSARNFKADTYKRGF